MESHSRGRVYVSSSLLAYLFDYKRLSDLDAMRMDNLGPTRHASANAPGPRHRTRERADPQARANERRRSVGPPGLSGGLRPGLAGAALEADTS